MFVWNSLVGTFVALLCTLAQAYGGNFGLAIITISVLVRLALLPLSLKMARHAQAQQKIIYQLKEQIAALKKQHKSDPRQLATEMSSLYQRHGVKPIDARNLASGLVQAGVGAGIYSAIRRNTCPGGRFFWMHNLAQPDALLVLVTGLITLAASALAPRLPEQSRILTTVVPALLTVIVAWRLSSAVVLYWAASAAMNGVQGAILRQRAR